MVTEINKKKKKINMNTNSHHSLALLVNDFALTDKAVDKYHLHENRSIFREQLA